jgi:hypothetical protein
LASQNLVSHGDCIPDWLATLFFLLNENKNKLNYWSTCGYNFRIYIARYHTCIASAFFKIQNKTNEKSENTIHGKKTIRQSGEKTEVVSIFVLSKKKTHC